MTEVIEKIKKARNRIRIATPQSEKVVASKDGNRTNHETTRTRDDDIRALRRELYGKEVADIMDKIGVKSSSNSPMFNKFVEEKPTVLVSNEKAPVLESNGGSLKRFELGVAKAIVEFRKQNAIDMAVKKKKMENLFKN